jgi:hypothetical protein
MSAWQDCLAGWEGGLMDRWYEWPIVAFIVFEALHSWELMVLVLIALIVVYRIYVQIKLVNEHMNAIMLRIDIFKVEAREQWGTMTREEASSMIDSLIQSWEKHHKQMQRTHFARFWEALKEGWKEARKEAGGSNKNQSRTT